MKLFGNINNVNIYSYTIENKILKAEILNYGGIVKSLYINGIDVIAGFDTLEGYLKDTSYQGAIIGRYANRIPNGVINIDDKVYHVDRNENSITQLHGGFNGFNKKVWKVKEKNNSLILNCFSPDGESGFPGNLNTQVTYSIHDDALIIEYKAVSDIDTALNLTNHMYFNLNGIEKGTIENHKLKIYSNYVSEIDENLLPTGKKNDVENTIFDFKTSKILENLSCNELKQTNGYDHNFYLNKQIDNFYTYKDLCIPEAAELSTDNCKMNIYTTKPCIQLYTGNYLTDNNIFKYKINQKPYSALCLETQYAPNDINFSGNYLKADEIYYHITVYKFS